jgi:amino acid transporter
MQTWGARVLGPAKIIIPIAVILSTFGAANGSCFSGCRLAYVAAREHHLPEVLSFVHTKKFTPLPSVIFCVSDSTLVYDQNGSLL